MSFNLSNLKYSLPKLIILFCFCLTIIGCRTTQDIIGDQYLLDRNVVIKNEQLLKKDPLNLLLVDQPNSKVFGIPLKLRLHDLANPYPDSIFDKWLLKKPKRKYRLEKLLSAKQVKELKRYNGKFNNWLKSYGETPVFLDSSTITKNTKRLEQYFKNKGYFDTHVSVEKIILPKQKVTVEYHIKTDKQYTIDSISRNIISPSLDSLYQNASKNQIISPGDPFEIDRFEAERSRLINYFRNNGVYNFQQNSLKFTAAIDSTGFDSRIPVIVEIANLQKRENDTLRSIPYLIHKIKKINLYVNSSGELDQLSSYTDSLDYEDYTIFFKGKLKYRPKALTEVIFIKKDSPYSDLERSLTYRYISNLRNFKYPSISYSPLKNDSSDLLANIYLNPKKRFSMGFDLDLSHSNIQDFGISLGTSFAIRNIFRGAETLEISAKNTLGSSSDIASINSELFNLYELGADIKLRIPRILFPINLENVIPKRMNPTTDITLGASLQQNIGLDKQYFGSSYQVKWAPNKMAKVSFKIIDLEFINNQNTSNYFNVYRNSFDKLNSIAGQYNNNSSNINNDLNLIIPEGATTFIDEVLSDKTALTPEDLQYQDVNRIRERQNRLTANNLIIGSSLGINYNSQENILDESFFQLQGKLSLVGSLLNQVLKSSGADKNELGQYEIDGVAPSQHIKTELNFIKHWQTSVNSVLAFRAFGGIAIPFGNAQSIPFSRSYFSGGSNDNRAWRAYRLGPGSSNSLNEFNEANFKLSFNLEYRFPIVRKIKGALFIDAGNIWNVLDDVDDPAFRFDGLKDLNEIAVGTGFGLRYDFNFFVFRFDTGFKTHNPALSKSLRWGGDYSIKSAVFNIGINYPF